ncbi:MAG: hypothetical protein NZ699_10455, partial [Roseiflexus sp.]|nr:hypothetical protein [Roseiflexus sp.]
PEPPSGRPGGASQPASDLPDWLRDLAAAPPEPPSGRPAAATHPPTDIHECVSDLDAAPPGRSSARAGGSGAQQPASDLPDWLREIAAAPPEPPAAPPEPPSGQPAGSPHLPPASDLPDWLRDLAAAPPEPPSGRPAGSPHLPPASDLPDWLREIAAALPEPPAAPSEPPPRRPSGAPQPVSDLSDQLQTTAPLSQETPPWLESEHKQLPAAAPGDALLPDWPRGADGVLSDTRDGRSQISQPAAPQISSDLLSGTDLPDWLRGEPESKPESVPFSPPNLDDWLVRLRSATDDEVGVGALVAAPKLAPPPAPKRSEEQLRALSLLRHLAAEPIPATTPLLAPAPESVLRRVGVERLLSITLLILAIIAVAFPGIAPFLETPPVMPAVSTAHEQIAALDANDVALIGYEWDARRVGELRPLEQAVIGQLIAQNVKLILVSTDPQGTLLQFDLLDALRDAGYRQQGEGYLLLGYKPGGEIALRTLGRDFQGMLRSDYRGDDATGSALIAGIDTGRPIASLNDLSLIIVLADDTSDVQGWMEQVYPQLQTGNRPVSLVFLLPEEAAPIVQPYMRQPGVVAIAGQRGALAYMALNQGGGASEVAKAAIQHRLTILLFVVVLLFGLAISGIDAVRRRRT